MTSVFSYFIAKLFWPPLHVSHLYVVFFRFTVNMVEARWRTMVTMYKTMVDHNMLPNVETQNIAYKKDLEELVKYTPQRRHNYEKKKGRSVKMGKFYI